MSANCPEAKRVESLVHLGRLLLEEVDRLDADGDQEGAQEIFHALEHSDPRNADRVEALAKMRRLLAEADRRIAEADPEGIQRVIQQLEQALKLLPMAGSGIRRIPNGLQERR